jgi:hypothetical protein
MHPHLVYAFFFFLSSLHPSQPLLLLAWTELVSMKKKKPVRNSVIVQHNGVTATGH